MTRAVTVSRIWQETPEICCFELIPDQGGPVTFTPGAHIDVHLPNDLIRQYSLWNGPDDTQSYLIGVKREPHSRGGSVAVHNLVQGDKLQISDPRNNFELDAGDGPALLLAGGIGITPLLSMARHLNAKGRDHCLHLFARDAVHAPFQNELAVLPEAPVHLGLVPTALDRVLAGILDGPAPDAHLYLCGPGPFMDLAERQAALAGWTAAQVHLERFSADPNGLDNGGEGFEVLLKQSGKSICVEEGKTIIEAMEAAGIVHLTSCEMGVCGTCMATVIEGEPDHRDQYLNDTEKASGKVIMPCVSRCKGKRLVLDL